MTEQETTYHRHVERAMSTGNCYVFRRQFLVLFPGRYGREAAMFLQDVINLTSLDGAPKQTIGDKTYALCTRRFLSGLKYRGWTEEEQKSHFNTLLGKKYILSKRVGMPPRRWVWVDYG